MYSQDEFVSVLLGNSCLIPVKFLFNSTKINGNNYRTLLFTDLNTRHYFHGHNYSILGLQRESNIRDYYDR